MFSGNALFHSLQAIATGNGGNGRRVCGIGASKPAERALSQYDAVVKAVHVVLRPVLGKDGCKQPWFLVPERGALLERSITPTTCRRGRVATSSMG